MADYKKVFGKRMPYNWQKEGARGFWTDRRIDIVLWGVVLFALVLTWKLV